MKTDIEIAQKAEMMPIKNVAEQLGITEEFLTDALTCYKQRYGTFATTGNYIILFEPSLSVIEIK